MRVHLRKLITRWFVLCFDDTLHGSPLEGFAVNILSLFTLHEPSVANTRHLKLRNILNIILWFSRSPSSIILFLNLLNSVELPQRIHESRKIALISHHWNSVNWCHLVRIRAGKLRVEINLGLVLVLVEDWGLSCEA